jgi:hypothetical protein
VAAVVAAPVNAPTNVVDVTLVNPATVVTVDPSVSAVLPNVTVALAKRACANVPVEMLLAFSAVSAEPFPDTLVKSPFVPLTRVPLTLPDVTFPVTDNDPNVPTEVIFVCAAVVSVPTILVPDKLPLVMLPVTAKLPNVPTDVMLVCAAVVNVPTILVPDKLPPLMLPVADMSPVVERLPAAVLP